MLLAFLCSRASVVQSVILFVSFERCDKSRMVGVTACEPHSRSLFFVLELAYHSETWYGNVSKSIYRGGRSQRTTFTYQKIRNRYIAC